MEISELKAELEKLHPASCGWALSCCASNHSDAEEVLQMVYLKILQGKAIYRGESKLQTWLLAVWTWSRSIQTPNIAIQLPPSATFEAPGSVKLQPPRLEPRHQKHIARRRRVDRSVTTEAALLSNWQSPTQGLMTSPTDLALGSLPALNQSAKDLESFLSKNSEIMKESNR